MDVLERREVCYNSILKTASVIQTIKPLSTNKDSLEVMVSLKQY
jgi:hypothetical protein